MISALQSGCYELTWERCADLPSPMYDISAVLHDRKVYIMAGEVPDDDTYDHVYCYNITTDQWEQLPPHKYIQGRLQIINGHLTVIGGWNINTNMATNNVSTLINNSWTNHYPNLSRARCKPGVVSHSEYVIVAGGVKDKNTFHNDIEILNTTQPSHWIMTSILLPEPMWNIFPTISDNMIVIVGYTGANTFSSSYQLPVGIITSSTTPPATSGQPVQWMKLPSAPHYNTITIPNSHPPVIMGGHDLQYVPTSDVAMLDDSRNKWKRIASLSNPRAYLSAVPIDSDTIFVLGGTKGGQGAAANRASSVTTVEKGIVTLTQRAAAIPTEDTWCSIQ